MNAVMERGMDACAYFFRNGHVMLADKSIATTGNLTRERFENIGWDVAKQRYRSTEAREDFASGWLVFGLPTIEMIRSGSLSAKEGRCNQSETMRTNVIPFRTRRAQ